MADRDTSDRQLGYQGELEEFDLLIPATSDDRDISTKQAVLLAI
jgi:hypothetical protein